MKKQLILGSLLALAGIINAQTWTSASGQETTVGNVGIGTTTPGFKLDVALGSQYDGVNINGNGATGNAGLFLRNSTNSTLWQMWNLGSGNLWGSGNFCIYDGSSSVPQIIINRSSGNVGIGTISPGDGKIHAVNAITSLPSSGVGYSGQFEISTNQVGTYAAVLGANTSNLAGNGNFRGVQGQATGNGTTIQGISSGVYGSATGSYFNFGGHFDVTPTSNSTFNAAVLGDANGYSSAWAAYFNGNVFASGTFTSSDKKLKENIKSLTGALDKIKLLKPSSYTFKRDEFPGLGLPEGQQMGLIAQELETVFPDLIKEVSERNTKNEKGDIVKNPNFKSVNYTGLIPVLIAGIQEQQAQLDNQQKQMDAQNQLISELTNQLNNNAKILSPTGIDAIQGATGFNMDQNVPNPFSSETVIKYTLTNQSKSASLIVYDLSGKQITSFALDNSASSITITSEKLPAGIYIYSIMADGKIMDSKRMVVANK